MVFIRDQDKLDNPVAINIISNQNRFLYGVVFFIYGVL